MNFIIMGDRFQKRMKSKGCTALIKVNNKTIIDNQYKCIKKFFPKSNIIYVSGFESKRLISHIDKNKHKYSDLKIVTNNKYQDYNYGYSLALIKDALNTDGFITFGDNILNTKVFKNFDTKSGSQVFIQNNERTDLGCVVTEDTVEHISYELTNYIANIYYLSAADMQNIQKILSIDTYYNVFIFELINLLIEHNTIIKPFFIG